MFSFCVPEKYPTNHELAVVISLFLFHCWIWIPNILFRVFFFPYLQIRLTRICPLSNHPFSLAFESCTNVDAFAWYMYDEAWNYLFHSLKSLSFNHGWLSREKINKERVDLGYMIDVTSIHRTFILTITGYTFYTMPIEHFLGQIKC